LSNKINLTIATDINGKGGVSSVLNVLQEHHFFLETKTKLIVSHRNSAKLNTFKQLFTFFTCILKLLFNIAFFDVGLVHIHMASRGSYTRKAILIRIAHFFKVKIIIHLHGAEFEHFYNTECIDSKKKHIRETFNMANKVIVLSSQWLDWLSTILDDKSKGVVIYNAVPFLTLDTSKQSDFVNFVFLGRLGERKGVADLISAFGDVVKNYPDARLLLGGDGELTKFNDLVCSLGLKDKVTFLGWVSGNEKLEILKKAILNNSFKIQVKNVNNCLKVLNLTLFL
jgi:glycosyltransferase involved in cell wall biosynthesis